MSTSAKRYMVTSGLPYSNGRLHVGHIAGAYLPADTYVRYRRARGDDVRFVCGSDDNGVASLISARKEGRSVEELTADYNARQAKDFIGLGIDFDIFGGTHQPAFVKRHEQISQSFFTSILEQDYFVKRTTEQLYDEQAQQFLPDRFVRGTCYHTRVDGSPCGYTDAYGDQCESCGNAIDPIQLIDPVSTITETRPQPRPTTHWYLRLDRFEEPLRQWLERHREAAADRPAWRETVLNFALGQIKSGLPERAMTRDLDWGVPVPLDDPDAKGKMLYVWFDAPIGYVSFTASLCEQRDGDWRGYEAWWKNPDTRILHFIGEDNIVFHALIWPAMMMAEGSFQLPWQVVANSFLNMHDEKISKSRGTAFWIDKYLERFDPDPLRYYLTAIAPENQQTSFDIDDFAARVNGELNNALGNFVHRTLTFVDRYFDGRVPAAGSFSETDQEQLQAINTHVEATGTALDDLRFKAALGEVMALARAGNGYFDRTQPWKQRKEDPTACATTMHICLRTVRALTTIMAPFLPFSAQRCAEMLKLDELSANERSLAWERATEALPEGHHLGPSEVLFNKLDAEELNQQAS